MRVIEVESRGGPEVLSLAERPAPQPGPGQIVAEVDAAGVNYMDIYQREGVGGYRPPLPFVTGGEGAGTVIAVGEGVLSPAVGDRVAWVGPGSYAEQVVLPGDVTVVHAAAGGVGLLLTQMVKRRGGIVVATCSGGQDADKQRLAREAGADHVAG